MKKEQEYILDNIESDFFNEISVKYNSQKDFTSLEAWKKARLLKLFFYKEVIPNLPAEEKFNLNQQIRRAGISITANISEGQPPDLPDAPDEHPPARGFGVCGGVRAAAPLGLLAPVLLPRWPAPGCRCVEQRAARRAASACLGARNP